MKTLLVICFVLTVTVLGKESVSDLVSLLENPEVLQEIVKRLGHDDPVEKSRADSSTDGSCQFKNFSNTIIQTKASTAAGAAFLDSQSGLSSNHDCIQRCCELDGCELAVYENKGDRNCYLFRCKDPDNNKNYCEFASLDGYISSSITHDIKAEKIFQTSSNSDHENDLQDLSESGKLVETSTTSTTTTTTTTTETPELPHSVSIGGVCKTNIGCEDSHAFCLNGICACRTSYYNKHGTCREVCGHSRFECKVVDLDGPDCIRNSLVCDGRKDCHDGSDELNCQTDDDDKSQDKPSNIKTKPHHQTIEQNDDKKIKKPPPTPVNVKNNPKPPQDTHTKELSTDTQQNVSEENTEKESNEESKSPKVTEESESNQEESKQSTDSSESKDEQTDDQTKETPEDTDTSVESKDEKDFTVEETESLLVSKEKMALDSPIQTAQGPIIALSLGLGFTFLLLVFIGCRLRNMKRRLRKGRVLHSNEADYLINGMYL